MSQTYAPRRRAENAAPAQEAFQTTVPGPSLQELAAGAAPSREQLGRRVDLPEAIRAKMEASFGADFSNVKLYESRTVADAGADAMAMGGAIGFAPGKLELGSTAGQAMLGHELSHVVSQARGEVRGSGFLADAGLEARADREGALAAAGESVYAGPVTPLSASAVPASTAGVAQAIGKKEEQIQLERNRQRPPSDELITEIPSIFHPGKRREAKQRLRDQYDAEETNREMNSAVIMDESRETQARAGLYEARERYSAAHGGKAPRELGRTANDYLKALFEKAGDDPEQHDMIFSAFADRDTDKLAELVRNDIREVNSGKYRDPVIDLLSDDKKTAARAYGPNIHHARRAAILSRAFNDKRERGDNFLEDLGLTTGNLGLGEEEYEAFRGKGTAQRLFHAEARARMENHYYGAPLSERTEDELGFSHNAEEYYRMAKAGQLTL